MAFSRNNTAHARTKHIDIRAYWAKDLVKIGILKLVHIKTHDQLADMMTKFQLKKTCLEHVRMLMNMNGNYVVPASYEVAEVAIRKCECCTCWLRK